MHLDSEASEMQGICFVKVLGVYNVLRFACANHTAMCENGICMHIFLIQLCFVKG